MPTITAHVSCPIRDSFRVQQIAGMFDLPLVQTAHHTFSAELPEPDDDWQIGAIVGPSGSGKSTIARQAFGAALYEPAAWPADRAVIDCITHGLAEEPPVRDVTALLTAVGFSSPPAWLKPYPVLSRGEQFRCDLARALLAEGPLVAFDEFTSVVDRTVAKIGSAAVARAVRKGRIAKRFVAVTCHYDILEWLAPDWHLDLATGHLERRGEHSPRDCLRRPPIELEIVRVRPAAWRMFARHHYLSSSLPGGCRAYLALWNDQPVAFCAVASLYGSPNRRRITRIVTLPDYQGVGIGVAVLNHVSALEVGRGMRVNITASHPAIIGYCRRSPYWKAVNVKRIGGGQQVNAEGVPFKSSSGRSVVSFEFIGTGVTGA